jgi:hypothetical protein
MKTAIENVLKLFSLTGIGLALWAVSAFAVQVPDNQLLPDPEKALGGPVVYIQLTADSEKETAYQELKKEKDYILGYQELSLQDMNTDHPRLETWTYNQKKRQATKTVFNWNMVNSIQLLDPKVKIHE